MRSQNFFLKTGTACVLYLLFLILLPKQLDAQTASAPSSGDGSSGDPYQIATLDNLYWITQNSSEWSAYFIQTADIDASSSSSWDSGSGYSSIGSSSTNFTGSYDGQGYTITGLTINRNGTSNIGMFGIIDGATLTNIALEDIDFTGEGSVGGLIGEAYGASTITSNYVTGSISGDLNIGGLVGNFEPGSTSDIASAVFSKNYSTASVSGTGYVGGITGLNFGNISDCYTTGSVTATGTGSNRYAGGIAGQSDESITNCYASGAVSGNDPGGFVGKNSGTVSGGYWDTETSGLANAFDTDNNSQTATGLTSSEMRYESQFSGWDYSTIWDIEEGLSFPYLQNMAPDSLPGKIYIAKVPSGEGTEAEPYLISSFAELIWVSENTSSWGSFFQQTANITDSLTTELNAGSGFSPIGTTSSPFSGTYNGDSFTITNLFIDRDSENNIGLFGRVDSASIINIGLENANITGQDSVGALAGKVTGNSIITGNYSTGSLDGRRNVGGLLGHIESSGSFTNNHSSASATGSSSNVGGLVGESSANIFSSYATGAVSSGGSSAGGLVGYMLSDTVSTSYATGDVYGSGAVGGLIGSAFGYIEYSYATGEISGGEYGFIGGLFGDLYGIASENFSTGNVSSSNDYAGGLFGYIEGTILDSYSTGNVSGISEVGGLGGASTGGTITNSYSYGFVNGSTNIGGFLGVNSGTITGGYWNTETSGQSNGIGSDSNGQTVNGRTTTQMKNETNFSGYDFTDTWAIDEGNSFAYLQNIVPTSLPGTGILASAPSGYGTEASPYLISSFAALYWLSQNSAVWDSTFLQTENIDASESSTLDSGAGFSPIGNASIPFGGTYNGDSLSISNLFIDRDTEVNVGLFGKVKNATLTNISLVNSDITGQDSVGVLVGNVSGMSTITDNSSSGTISGNNDLGGLVGSHYSTGSFTNNSSSVTVTATGFSVGGLIGESSGNISNSYATGDVTSGNDDIGGLIGYATGDTVSNSYATGNVSGIYDVGGLIGISECHIEFSYASGDVSGEGYVGGLSGFVGNNIDNSFATGSVSSSGIYAGGLFGRNSGGNVSNSYSSGAVTGVASVGGLGGKSAAAVINSYTFSTVNGASNVGGLLGENTGTISGGYWNTETSGQTLGIGSDQSNQTETGLNTTEMKAEANFSDFDFTSAWAIDEGNSFPYLQNLVPDPLPTASTFAVAPSGQGTSESPYLISSISELYWLSINTSVWDSTFQQTANIDASETSTYNSGSGFSPIGTTVHPFSGTYDGDEFTISNLFIDRETEDNIGLFGVIDSASLSNIGLENATITGKDSVGVLVGKVRGNPTIMGSYTTGTVDGVRFIGGLVGAFYASGTFSDNHSSATVTASNFFAGGLIGEATGNTTISNCYATGDITSDDTAGGLIAYVDDSVTVSNSYATGNVNTRVDGGGLIGILDGLVEYSYATGNVTGTGNSIGGLIGHNIGTVTENFSTGDVSSSGTQVGGLVGLHDNGNVITNSYSTGSVTGDSEVGGLVGLSNGAITNAYAYGFVSGTTTVGAFLGKNVSSGTISGGYWNTSTSGQTSGIGSDINSQTVIGLSTSEMRNETNFSAFGFTSTWTIDEGNSFPYLQNIVPSSLPGTGTLSTTPSGEGTASSPYLISNLAELYWLSVNSSVWDSTFQQTADIDASETVSLNDSLGFSPIGNGTIPFQGAYDGNSYSISGLTIDRDTTDNVAFFGYLAGSAAISNLTLESITITGYDNVGGLIGQYTGNADSLSGNSVSGSVTGHEQVGGLIGLHVGSAMITQNSASVTVNASGDQAGGLIGESHGGDISNSYATGDVTGINDVGGLVGDFTSGVSSSYSTGTVTGSGNRVGGLIGNYSGSSLNKVFATGNVTGSGTYTGGLLGYGASSAISNCYATGDVTGDDYVGGLAGASYNNISNCYSTGAVSGSTNVAGFLGVNSSTITGAYWNTETSGQVTAIAQNDNSQTVTGRTSAEMKQDSSFSTFDLDNTWSMYNGISEPYLQALAPDSLADFPISYFPTGSGSESDPYLISDLDNLYWLSQVEEAWLSNTYFQQTADIDASETANWDDGDGGDAEGFSPIGTSSDKFLGSYDGAGYTISGLTIYRSSTKYVGFFGYTEKATLKNIGLLDVDITGGNDVGGLLGYSNGNSTVSGSYTTGSVSGTSSIGGLAGAFIHSSSSLTQSYSEAAVVASDNFAGGLVGSFSGTMEKCYATGTITGGGNLVGGLVGSTYGDITQAYATGSVSGVSKVGGLVGSNGKATISESFAFGNVTGTSSVGGLVGYHSGEDGTSDGNIEYSYSTGTVIGSSDTGGFIGKNVEGHVYDSYWYVNGSGQSNGIGTDDLSQTVTELTTAQMIDSTNFSGWDFESDTAWAIDDGFSFPYLPTVGDHRMVVAQIDSGEGWRMIGNPGDVTYSELLDPVWTQGFTGADSESGSSNVYFYEEATQSWASPSSANDYFGSADSTIENTSLNGVLFYVYADDNADGSDDSWPKYLVAENSTVNQSYDVNLSYSDNVSADSAGWNLISNPYPVSLDWTEVVTNDDITNTFPVAYIWDDSLNSGEGAYRINYGYPLPPGLPQDLIFDGPIPAMQAFWVKATATSASLGFKPDYQGSSQVLYKTDSKQYTPEMPWLSLKLKAGDFSDQVTLFGNLEDAPNYDVPKLPTIASNYVELGFSIDSLNWTSKIVRNDDQLIPLKLSSTQTGTFTLSWETNQTFFENYEVTLINEEDGSLIPLEAGTSYSFELTKKANPQLSLKVVAINTVGNEPGTDLPTVVSLDQNYPNPFNPSTNIRFELPETGNVELTVFDVLGRKVATLLNERVEAGYHQIQFNARSIASGMYIYQLRTANTVITKKLTLIK